MKVHDAEPKAPEIAPATPQRPRDNATIALLESWLEEDAKMTPEEAAQAEKELEEFLQALNRNRVEAGERPLFE
ncbi:hypothetical protein F183_A07230 [Bryobacterales bacterium F-183]|nr:hypothetical protein F183_A07230 [Bryobacterales bacterium F-183]